MIEINLYYIIHTYIQSNVFIQIFRGCWYYLFYVLTTKKFESKAFEILLQAYLYNTTRYIIMYSLKHVHQIDFSHALQY